MKPTQSEVDKAIEQLEHPRILAQRALANYHRLPIINQHDDKGARVLDVDEVLRRTEPRLEGKR